MSKKSNTFRDFTEIDSLYLVTRDPRVPLDDVALEYGDDNVAGRLIEVHYGGNGVPGETEVTCGYVKVIKPDLSKAWEHPLKCINQSVNKEGNLILFAEIRHHKNSTKEISDRHRTDSKRIMVEVYRDSVLL